MSTSEDALRWFTDVWRTSGGNTGRLAHSASNTPCQAERVMSVLVYRATNRFERTFSVLASFAIWLSSLL